MSDWSLLEIRNKVKEYIGDSRFDDDDLNERINRIYRDSMPIEFSVDDLGTVFNQTLVDGTESYTVDPDTYLWVRGPAYIDDLESDTLAEITFTKDKYLFRSSYPEVASAGDVADYDGQPVMVLYDKHTLFFGPIPDDSYETYFESYTKPTALSADGDKPIQQTWGSIIACDVAISIKIGREDEGGIQGIQGARNHFASIIRSREIGDLVGVRASGRF